VDLDSPRAQRVLDRTQGDRQRRLLEAEGIPFNGDRVDLRAARLPD
jgi:hypothetical protein